MKVNIGTIDRVVRTLAALAVAVLYFTGRISGTVAIVLGLFATIFLLTGLVSWCPVYLPFGLSTMKRRPITPAPCPCGSATSSWRA